MVTDFRLLLSRAARTTTRYFQERAAELDLSVVQAQALIAIEAQPGISVGSLAASLSKDQASTSIVIDRLMSLGLVTRQTDPADRRRARLYLTAQSEPLVARMDNARRDINRLVLDALGHERSHVLEARLVELLTAIEGGEAQTDPAATPPLIDAGKRRVRKQS